MTEQEEVRQERERRKERRAGWLWFWILIFAAAVFLVLMFAWPATEPPATPAPPPASGHLLDGEGEAPVVELLRVGHVV